MAELTRGLYTLRASMEQVYKNVSQNKINSIESAFTASII